MTTRDNTSRSSGGSASTLSTAAVDGHPDLGYTGDVGDSGKASSTPADLKHRAHDSAVAVADQAKDAAGSLGRTVRRKPAPVATVLAGLAATAGAAGLLRRRRAAKTPRARLGRILAKLPGRH